MPNRAEIKADLFYYGTRYIGEPVLSLLGKRPNPDQSFNNPEEKTEVLTAEIQTHIDGANFGVARKLNGRLQGLTRQLSGNKRVFYEATALAKEGWIDGYETGFARSLEHFHKAREVIEAGVQRPFPNKEIEELYWTTIHFAARARVGLASQGIDRKENLQNARRGFNADKEHLVKLAKNGEPHPDNIAFQDGWLAIVSMMEGKFEEAHASARAMREGFNQSLEPGLESAGTAHSYLVEGLIFTEEGNLDEARKQFFKAEAIRKEVALDRLRRGFALAGIARTFYREAAYLRAAKYGFKAAISHPVSILYGLNSHLAA